MRVVALGALVELDEADASPDRAGTADFSVSEYAVLEDGRRLTLHDERGWSSGPVMVAHFTPPPWPPEPAAALWSTLNRDDIVRTTLAVVEPDDDDDPDDHPYRWLAQLLGSHGVAATAEELRPLPYAVEFGPRLEARLADR
jgi:hypothetical protein